MGEFLSRESGLKTLDVEAARVIKACTNTDIQFDEKAEVVDVCKAVQEMNERARQAGKQEGRLEALCDSIKNVMESFHLTVEEAMKVMKVTAEDQAILKKMI